MAYCMGDPCFMVKHQDVGIICSAVADASYCDAGFAHGCSSILPSFFRPSCFVTPQLQHACLQTTVSTSTTFTIPQRLIELSRDDFEIDLV